MTWYILSGVLLAAVIILIIYILRLRRRQKALADRIEDFLNGGQALEVSLKEDSLSQVENAAADLENSVLVLKDRLRQETERTSSLTADISHQLKTPLASLKLLTELDNAPHCAAVLEQTERMENLIGSLLRLEKLSADGYSFNFGEGQIEVLIKDIAESLKPLYPEKKIEIRGSASARFDRGWLGEALGNILKNACEHTAENEIIQVRIEQTEHSAFITVEDNGGGVSEEDLPHLFERFYKAKSAEAASTIEAPSVKDEHIRTGSGLGLAIAKEIVLRHHGTISAANTQNGLKIEIRLPIRDLRKT